MASPAAPEPAPGHPEILRLVAPNPGPMTLAGTNSYLVGSEPAYLIDPGPANSDHLGRITEAAAKLGGIAGILLTHSHADHSEAVPHLDAPLLWGEVSTTDEQNPPPANAPSAGGDARGGNASTGPAAETVGPFTVIPTPGHASDHVCFVLGDVVFCGDLVLGEGSTMVPPAALGGSLADYMQSLERLREISPALMCPGHGSWIPDSEAKIEEYLEHRRAREAKLIAALEAGERSRARLLAAAWDDVPELLRPAAAVAMQAHLEKLQAEGSLPQGLED